MPFDPTDINATHEELEHYLQQTGDLEGLRKNPLIESDLIWLTMPFLGFPRIGALQLYDSIGPKALQGTTGLDDILAKRYLKLCDMANPTVQKAIQLDQNQSNPKLVQHCLKGLLPSSKFSTGEKFYLQVDSSQSTVNLFEPSIDADKYRKEHGVSLSPTITLQLFERAFFEEIGDVKYATINSSLVYSVRSSKDLIEAFLNKIPLEKTFL
jgi:hypothetical protein